MQPYGLSHLNIRNASRKNSSPMIHWYSGQPFSYLPRQTSQSFKETVSRPICLGINTCLTIRLRAVHMQIFRIKHIKLKMWCWNMFSYSFHESFCLFKLSLSESNGFWKKNISEKQVETLVLIKPGLENQYVNIGIKRSLIVRWLQKLQTLQYFSYTWHTFFVMAPLEGISPMFRFWPKEF